MAKLLQKTLNLLLGTEFSTDDTIAMAKHLPKTAEKTQKPLKRPFRKMTERELIQLESDIGAQLFGGVPKGHRREFFNLDLSTWIWYDEWLDAGTGQRRSTTIRYEIHENGILKVQEGARYSFIDGQELENFMSAIHLYYERVARELYHTEPHHQHSLHVHSVA